MKRTILLTYSTQQHHFIIIFVMKKLQDRIESKILYMCTAVTLRTCLNKRTRTRKTIEINYSNPFSTIDAREPISFTEYFIF